MTETAVKERGILFTAAMILAILAGNKTQTRRVIKPQLEPDKSGRGGLVWPKRAWIESERQIVEFCPYGEPGDRLWVRETWAVADELTEAHTCDPCRYIAYRADKKVIDWYGTNMNDVMPFTIESGMPLLTWKPSIHMPRWACRLLLDVTEIRVERVQDISELDALAEGIEDGSGTISGTMVTSAGTETRDDWIVGPARDGFKALWNSINASPKPVHARGEDGKKFVVSYVSYPWEEGTSVQEHRGKPHQVYGNPWVWPISFKRPEPASG